MPQGFYAPSALGSIKLGDSSTPGTESKVSSTSASFIGNFIMGVVDEGFDILSASDLQTLTVSDVQSPGYITSAAPDFVGFVSDSVAGGSCVSAQIVTPTGGLTIGTLTNVDFTPITETKRRGADNLM